MSTSFLPGLTLPSLSSLTAGGGLQGGAGGSSTALGGTSTSYSPFNDSGFTVNYGTAAGGVGGGTTGSSGAIPTWVYLAVLLAIGVMWKRGPFK
jgi:hypothetical protein